MKCCGGVFINDNDLLLSAFQIKMSGRCPSIPQVDIIFYEDLRALPLKASLFMDFTQRALSFRKA
jgi:hypothetical protein